MTHLPTLEEATPALIGWAFMILGLWLIFRKDENE